MRIRIKVTDLNLRQWDHLVTQVPVDGRTFLPGIPRVCVEFVLTPYIQVLHIEMDSAEFLMIMLRLEMIRNEVAVADVAKAALTPDALPEPCEHGAAVVREDPSLFEAIKPVYTYEDGCKSYGPYQNERS